MRKPKRRSPKPPAGAPPAGPVSPTVPPPDDPLARLEGTGEAALDRKDMAEKRVAALERGRANPAAGKER